MSFFDIVESSGTFGIIIWIAVFSMWPVGIILGIASIIMAHSSKNNKLTLSFKILTLSFTAYIFIGSMGMILSSINSCEALVLTGAEKATSLALGLSNSLYTGAFTLLGSIPFGFFIVVSIMILHFKQESLTPIESMYEEDAK